MWEYGNSRGYRPFDSLRDDVAKLARYVAIDELFAASPIYDPALPHSALPDSIELDVNTFQGGAAPLIRPEWVRAHLQALRPDAAIATSVLRQSWTGEAAKVYQCWLSAWRDPAGIGRSCYPGRSPYGTAGEDQYFYEQDHHAQLTTGRHGYDIAALYWTVPNRLAPVGQFGTLSGLTDDDWTTGAQTYLFSIQWPDQNSNPNYGVGGSHSLLHEAGHYLGVPHPHDGVDNEQRLMFSPTGDAYFAYVGDESATPMSYLHLDQDFSQFDHDTIARNLTAAYLNAADTLLGQLNGQSRQIDAGVAARDADRHATRAVDATARRYDVTALTEAHTAYAEIQTLADRTNELHPTAATAVLNPLAAKPYTSTTPQPSCTQLPHQVLNRCVEQPGG